MYNGNWHLAAFRQSIAQNTDLQINALSDTFLTIQNNHFLPKVDLKLFAAFALGATIARAYLSNADILAVNKFYVRPVNNAAIPLFDPEIMRMEKAPLVISGQEEFICNATQTSAGAEIETVLCWFYDDQLYPVPPGQVYTVRATSSTTATSGAWSLLSYALDSALPAGEYAIVFSSVISANGIAHRWIFDDSGMRAGFLSSGLETDKIMREARDFSFGEAGRFVTYSLPKLEVLCGGADATHTIYMHVVRTKRGTVGI